jgi:adenine-specific DNA-methyltransferase
VTSYHHTRKYLLSNCQIIEIVDLDVGVFSGVTMSTIIFSLRHSTPTGNTITVKRGLTEIVQTIPQQVFIANDFVFNIFASSFDNTISQKLKSRSIQLGGLCKELIFGVVITKNISEVVFDKKSKNLKPFVEGRDIGRYFTPTKTRYLRYERNLLHRPRTPKVFEAPEKIMIQRITGGNNPLKATYDDTLLYNKESINNIILKDNINYGTKYVLSLVNSRLLNWFYKNTFTNASKLTVNLSKEYLSKLPIRSIDFTNPEEKKMHDDLVALVDTMLEQAASQGKL